jgi:hypothetical protein
VHTIKKKGEKKKSWILLVRVVARVEYSSRLLSGLHSRRGVVVVLVIRTPVKSRVDYTDIVYKPEVVVGGHPSPL